MSIVWASFGDIALLNLVITPDLWKFCCLSEGLPRVHSYNYLEGNLPAIQPSEKAHHVWQMICWLWCPWYICFHFWNWSYMAWPFHSILSCGH